MSALLNNPSDLSAWRQTLFYLSREVVLTADDFNKLWDYVSNFWTKRVYGKQKGLEREDIYYCRFYLSKMPKSQSNGIRSKGIRVANPCGMKLKMTMHYSIDGQVEAYTLGRFGDCFDWYMCSNWRR
jgi:hypothetical protein